MAPTVPAIEPTHFAAGETVRWTRTFGDFPSSEGWTVIYYFAGVDAFQVSGTASGSGYLFTCTADQTAAKKAGTYRWSAYAEQGAAGVDLVRYPIASGRLVLQPNITTAAPGTLQTHEERCLAILTAAIEGRLTADVEDFQIGGRAVKSIPILQLRKLKQEYAWAVWRQRNPGSIGAPIATEFAPADGVVGSAEPVSLPPWTQYARYGG